MGSPYLTRLRNAVPHLRLRLQQVTQTTRRRNHNIPTSLHPVAHLLSFTDTTHEQPDLKVVVEMRELDRLVRNLRRELARRADDEGADLRAREHTAHSVHQLLVRHESRIPHRLLRDVLDRPQPRLDGGDQETERLAGTRLRAHEQVARLRVLECLFALRRFAVRLCELREHGQHGSLHGGHVCEAPERLAGDGVESVKIDAALERVKGGVACVRVYTLGWPRGCRCRASRRPGG